MSSPPRSEITPEWLFGSRRAFLLGLAAASAALGLMACALLASLVSIRLALKVDPAEAIGG